MPRPPSADSILRNTKQAERKVETHTTDVASDMILPNVSAVEDFSRKQALFWSQLEAQTGLTGNKTGSFDLTTTGDISTTGGDINLSGSASPHVTSTSSGGRAMSFGATDSIPFTHVGTTTNHTFNILANNTRAAKWSGTTGSNYALTLGSTYAAITAGSLTGYDNGMAVEGIALFGASSTATAEQLQVTGDGLFTGDVTVNGDVTAEKGTFSSDTFPVLLCERTTTVFTDALLSAQSLNVKTSGNMADGFGAALTFRIEDATAGPNTIGRIDCVRDGADNSGKLIFHAFKNGALGNNLTIDSDGDIDCAAGDITTTGEYSQSKIKLTSIGGYAILLTNKSGSNSVAGNVVETHATQADAVDIAGANATDPIGVFLDDGVADGSEAWVVVNGIADVWMDAGGCAVHDRIITSATAGRGDVNNTPSNSAHFQEIGHAIEAAAANALARCVIHFL